MQQTIGFYISRLRNTIKAVKQDAFLTDRYLYSLILKHAPWIIKREDSSSKILSNPSTQLPLEFVDLVEVDKVQAQCTGIKSGCTIMRTKHRLPKMFDGYRGPLISRVTSIDGERDLTPTSPAAYTTLTKLNTHKYNKTLYYWYIDGYLYFPNIPWEAVTVWGMFEEDIANYRCETCRTCRPRQEQPCLIPETIFAEIESQISNDFKLMFGIQTDLVNDKQNPAR